MPRARRIGLDLWRLAAGRRNLISDVPGVAVGHCTIRRGASLKGRCKGVVRTGVSVVLLKKRDLYRQPAPAGVAVINGYGKALGLHQVEETGRLETPIAITNTLSIWDVGKALARWVLESHPDVYSVSPVVGECCDAYLNDIRGFHVKERHVREAIADARVAFGTGGVGAGTGMRGKGFKSGCGSSSRIVTVRGDGYTVGVFLVANTGNLANLRIGGFPAGLYLSGKKTFSEHQEGSIIVVMVTDAPLTSRRLGRMARRACHGLARAGLTSGHGSGDFVVAFSTAPAPELARPPSTSHEGSSRGAQGRGLLHEEDMTSFFEAAIEAVEEAFLDAVFQSVDTDGVEGHVVKALDLETVREMACAAGWKAGAARAKRSPAEK